MGREEIPKTKLIGKAGQLQEDAVQTQRPKLGSAAPIGEAGHGAVYLEPQSLVDGEGRIPGASLQTDLAI